MDFNSTNVTGTLANDQDAVTITLGPGQGSCLFVAQGTLKGTINFEGSVDNTNWAAVQVMNVATAAIATTAAVDGSGGAITTAWAGSVAGFTNVRARLHPTTSGTATVILRSGSAPSPVTSVNALPTGTNAIGVVELGDGVTPATKATVAQFHTSDNQALASGNALFTGGVAQILNPAGFMDRQRGAGYDGIPAVGVPTGVQELTGPALTTTFNGAVTGSGSSQTITVAATTSMVVGDILVTQDNVEYCEVLTVPSGTTFTAILKNNHANGQSLTWYHYNQARDATVGDAVAATGVSLESMALYNGSTFDRARSAGAGDGAASTGLGYDALALYNGVTFDRERGNLDNISIFASASRSSTQTGSDMTNYNHRGVIVVLDVTVDAGSTAINTLEIDGKDPVSGKYYAILTGAAVSTVSTNVYTIYPGNTATTNVSVSTILPRTWRVKLTYSGSGSATYSVGAMLIV